MDVLDQGILTIENTSLPDIGNLSQGSTVVYNSNAELQNIAPKEYFNLIVSGGNKKTIGITPIETIVTNKLVIQDGTLLELNKSMGRFLILEGTIEGTGLISGNHFANIIIEGSGEFGTLYFSQESEDSKTLGLLNIIRESGTIKLGTDLIIGTNINLGQQRGLKIDSGTLFIGSNSLTLKSPIYGESQQLATTPESNLTIEGNFGISIPATVSEINNFTINNTSTAGVSLSNDINIHGDLSINSGTFNAGDFNINIAGNWTSKGTFNPNNGTVIFKGTANQTITGTTTFYNLTIDADNVNVDETDGEVKIVNVLDLKDGAFNTNGKVVLLSDESGDARIAPVTGGTINGDLTVQRYIPSNGVTKKVYRYIASPVHGFTVAGIQQDGISVTGQFDGSSDRRWTSSLYYWDEEWKPFPVSSNTETLVNGTGYALEVMDANKQAITATINFKGTPKIGDASIQMKEGWNLVGNPYAAPIDWDKIVDTVNVHSEIAIKDNTGRIVTPGAHAYYSGGLSIPDDFEGIIASGQSFWVQARNMHTMTITEEHKAANEESGTFLRKKMPTDYMRIFLTQGDFRDETIVRFIDKAKEEYDSEFDANKKDNDFFDISTLTKNGQDLAINALPFVSNRSVKVRIKDVKPGVYRLSFSQFESLLEKYKIVLIDNFGEKQAEIGQIREYEFYVTDDTASYGDNRMQLLFTEVRMPVELAFKEVSGRKNSILNVPVQARNFADIGSLQFSVSWDPAIVEFQSANQFFDETIDDSCFDLGQIQNGKLAFSWDDQQGQSVTLQDNDSLFILSFKLIGTANQSALIEFKNDPLSIEIGDGNQNVLEYQTQNGIINILPAFKIFGNITASNGAYIQNASISDQDDPEPIVFSNNMGEYEFEIDAGKSYELSVDKNDVPIIEGLNVIDIALTRRHLLNKTRFDSPYQIIAADVDKNRKISTIDIALMRKAILRIEDNFPHQKSWIFIDKKHEFADIQNPFDFQDQVLVENIEEDKQVDFVGIKLGDVNLSWTDNAGKKEPYNFIEFRLDSIIVNRDNIYVPILIDNLQSASGLQYTVQWDPKVLSLTDIQANNFGCQLGSRYLTDGLLTVLWEKDQQNMVDKNEVFLGLNFILLSGSVPSRIIDINGKLTPMVAVDDEGNEIGIIADLFGKAHERERNYFVKNYPNPFSQQTTFFVNLPDNSPVTISIFDGLGRLIDIINDDLVKGQNKIAWKIPLPLNKTTKLLYYQVESKFGKLNGKLALE